MNLNKIIDEISSKVFTKEVQIECNAKNLLFTIGDYCLEANEKITIYDDPVSTEKTLKVYSLDEWGDALEFFYKLTGQA